MDTSLIEQIEGTIEALLFVSEKPISLEQFEEVLETVSKAEIKEAIGNLQKEYTQKNRGMIIAEIAGGYQMLSSSHHAMAIRRFYKTIHKEKLSKPALETLAIVAYKQPVARIDIELIRGVNSDGVVAHLLLKGLIKIAGRKEVPGRPFIYGTTQQFLEYFGLKSLDDLPKREEFPNLQTDVRHDVKTSENTSEEKIKKEVETFFKQAQDLTPLKSIEEPFQRNSSQTVQPEESDSPPTRGGGRGGGGGD